MAGINVNSSEPNNIVSKLYIADNEEKFNKIGGAEITSDAAKAREILTKLSLSLKDKKQPIKEKEINPNVDVNKIISKLPLNGSLKLPEDQELKTFFIFGIDESLPEYKITDFFEKFGKIKSFNCQHHSKCGYLTFINRKDAESASIELLKTDSNDTTKPALFIIDNIPLRCCWGKERSLGNSYNEKIKIGSIIGKVMRKLSSKRKIIESDSPNKKQEIEEYKSLSENFEI